MTYKEENYVLDTLMELQENNIMLRQIIRYLNAEIANADNENMNDFGRNVLANLISSGMDFRQIRKQFK